MPYLEGKPTIVRARHLVIQSHRGDRPVRYHNFMIRNRRWKLLQASGFGRESFDGMPVFQLFEISVDPLELHDQAAGRPDVVKEMRTEYVRWFADVGSTREDNYAPPRIHIGTKHENPVVLTRQDWRHTQGRPWARDSMGHWLLTGSSGTYEVRCRFSPNVDVGHASLRINDDVHMITLPPNASTCEFSGVAVPDGDVRLEVVLNHHEQRRGVHQADIEKIK